MTKLKAGKAYQLYVAIKTHFNSPGYDYFRFRGITGASSKSLNERNDHYTFDKIARLYTEEIYLDLLVSNFVENKNTYINDLRSKEAYDIYTKRQKIIQSFSYTLNKEVNAFFENRHNNIFVGSPNIKPFIVSCVLQEDLSLETFIALDNILRFSEKIKYTDIVWKEKLYTINKYRPFFNYDHNKAFSIIKKAYSEKYLQEKTTSL